MDAPLALNVIAIALSALSLGVSTALVRRQVSIMRHANALPVLVELTQDFRGGDFQRSEDYVLEGLTQDHPAELGISGLPDSARRSVTTVVTLYNSFAVMVALRMVDEAFVTSLFGYRVNRAWGSLEPYIRREREIRQGDEFGAFLEDLVCRIRSRPSSASHGIALRQLPRT